MKRPESILTATDLSAPARHAVERAFRLAALTDSDLHILHALQLDALDVLRELLGADLSATKAIFEKDAREQLEQLAADLGRESSIAAHRQIVSGTPLAEISSAADALDAAILVLGARGESFLRHTMLGSTAARLLRKSVRRPVLVVKQTPHEDYRKVLLAVDFSPVSLQLVRAAQRWAPGADLILLHAFELPYEGKLWLARINEEQITQLIRAEIKTRHERLHQFAATTELSPASYAVRVIHGDPSQQIIAMEQEYDADLIVLGKHGTHVAEELLLGSVTKHVLAEAQGDVLVIADPRPSVNDLP